MNRVTRSPSSPSRWCRVILTLALVAGALLIAGVPSAAQDPCTFVRGNLVDKDGATVVVDLNDAVGILAFLFLNGSVPNCLDAADVNDNGLVELSDYTYVVNFFFNGGPPPPAPYPPPGVDPTPGVVTVPAERDTRFVFKLGTGAGVANNTGISIPVTLSNEVPITGLTMVFQYSPQLIRVDELITEENTILSAQSAEYIIAEARNSHGMAFISALKDFATPFWFHDGSDPTIPAGQDQVVALLKCGIPIVAPKGFAPLTFTDGLRVPNLGTPPTSPELHNLVMLGPTCLRPVLASGGGIDIRRGFIRGDANMDHGVDISDPVFLLNYIFQGKTKPACMDAADANNDTRLDISDAIWLLNYSFQGGPQPSEPFPQPGVDPSDDGRGSMGCTADHN